MAKHADIHRFVTLLAERRARRDVEPELQRMSLARLLERANIVWHGVEIGQPDWSHHSHALAVSAENRGGGLAFHLMMNAYCEAVDIELPPAGVDGGSRWRRWIDTAQDTPNDIVAWHDAPPVPGPTYRAEPRSVVVLFARGF